jgi:hypothetical protein
MVTAGKVVVTAGSVTGGGANNVTAGAVTVTGAGMHEAAQAGVAWGQQMGLRWKFGSTYPPAGLVNLFAERR